MRVQDRGDTIFVSLGPGELLHEDAPAGTDLLALARGAKGCVVQIDLRQATFMAARCIGTLLRVKRILAAAGGRLVIVQPRSEIHELFEVTRVNRVIDIVPLTDGTSA